MSQSKFFTEITETMPSQRRRQEDVPAIFAPRPNQLSGTLNSITRYFWSFRKLCKRTFFDENGLKIEKSQASKNLSDTENIVTDKSLSKSSSTMFSALMRKKWGERKIPSCEPFDEPCKTNIEQLPTEVLQIILNQVSSGKDRKNCRLVNKLWYDVLCEHEEYLAPIIVDSKKGSTKLTSSLKTIGLRRLHLHFQFSYLEFLPEKFWTSIGGQICSLKLERCRLGGQVIESLIRSCENLQYLKIFLAYHTNLYETFCRPESLEKIDIVRKKLRTLEFCVATEGNMDQEDGGRIFAALFRIFPNIKNYSFGLSFKNYMLPMSFECSFTKVSSDSIADELQLCLMFSLLLTAENANWVKMLKVLHSVRLLSVSLHFPISDLLPEEHFALKDLFANQKALKTVKILPYDDQYTMLNAILFQILNSCGELSELVYCPSRTEDCFRSLKKEEWSTLSPKLSKLKKLTTGCLVIDNPISLHSSKDDEERKWRMELRYIFDNCFISLIPTFSHLEHVILTDGVSDGIMQCIFRYLTKLKTLDVYLGSLSTEYGIMGLIRCEKTGEKCYNSINRLQNLNKLILRGLPLSLHGGPFSDEIFTQFSLPQLKYLECFLPEHITTLVNLAPMIPLIRNVKFVSTKISYPVEKLSDFCHNTQNLETMAIISPKDEFLFEDTKNIFKGCPTLKTIHFNQQTYCCQ